MKTTMRFLKVTGAVATPLGMAGLYLDGTQFAAVLICLVVCAVVVVPCCWLGSKLADWSDAE